MNTIKKIGILTASRTNNFGTDLQAYAMQYVFSKYCEAEVINYACEKLEGSRRLLPKFTAKNLINLPYSFYKKITHNLFRKKYINYSKKKYAPNSLNEIEESYDAVVVGSDQIWNMNITGNDTNFFLPWKNTKTERYSYAASLGVTDIKEWEKEYKLSKYLHDFNKVSVRETSAIETLNSIGIIAQEDLDPIQLVDEDAWCNLATRCKKKPYMLIYLVESNIHKCEQAIRYAKEKNWEIIRVSPPTYPCKGVKTKSFVSLRRWMSLVKNANIVITDSYHGLSFAIANKVNFRLVKLKNEEKNTRSLCLLNKLSISDFVVGSIDNYDGCPEWEKVANSVQVECEKSMNYIKSICN